MGTYSYVSGDDKWEKPFQVTGYNDRLFEWNQHTITEFIRDQWVERPQGAHCENTKIWPYCLSAAGLGLQLYDKITTKEIDQALIMSARQKIEKDTKMYPDSILTFSKFRIHFVLGFKNSQLSHIS